MVIRREGGVGEDRDVEGALRVCRPAGVGAVDIHEGHGLRPADGNEAFAEAGEGRNGQHQRDCTIRRNIPQSADAVAASSRRSSARAGVQAARQLTPPRTHAP